MSLKSNFGKIPTNSEKRRLLIVAKTPELKKYKLHYYKKAEMPKIDLKSENFKEFLENIGWEDLHSDIKNFNTFDVEKFQLFNQILFHTYHSGDYENQTDIFKFYLLKTSKPNFKKFLEGMKTGYVQIKKDLFIMDSDKMLSSNFQNYLDITDIFIYGRMNKFPEYLKECKKVKDIHFNNDYRDLNGITFPKLEEMTILNIIDNFEDKFPDAPNLKDLKINKTQMKEIPFLPFPKLKYLNLDHNNITKIPTHFLYSPDKLDSLRLGYNYISNLENLPPNLNALFLRKNRLTDIDEVVKLKNLEYLDVSNNPFIYSLPEELLELNLISFKCDDTNLNEQSKHLAGILTLRDCYKNAGHEMQNVAAEGGTNTLYSIEDSDKIVKSLESKRGAAEEIEISELLGEHNIAPKVYDVFECDDTVNMVIQKLDITLQDYLGKFDTVELYNYDKLSLQLYEKLTEMAKLGVQHNDLKPDNVMLDTSRNIYIIDFGWSYYRGEGSTVKEYDPAEYNGWPWMVPLKFDPDWDTLCIFYLLFTNISYHWFGCRKFLKLFMDYTKIVSKYSIKVLFGKNRNLFFSIQPSWTKFPIAFPNKQYTSPTEYTLASKKIKYQHLMDYQKGDYKKVFDNVKETSSNVFIPFIKLF